MTLPHQAALSRDGALEASSVHAAEAHARGRTGRLPGRIEWTAGNVTRLVVAVSLAVGALAGVTLLGWSMAPPPFSADTSTPRGALGAYFVALSQGDTTTAVTLLCESSREELLLTGFVEVTGAPVRRTPMDPPVFVWEAEARGDDQFVVEATNAEKHSSHFWVVGDGDGHYRVCGFAGP